MPSLTRKKRILYRAHKYRIIDENERMQNDERYLDITLQPRSNVVYDKNAICIYAKLRKISFGEA